MMQGYNMLEAAAFILKCINPKEHKELADQLPELIPQIIQADMAYMEEAGVLDEEGYAGEGYYEDDEAFEYMVEKIVSTNDLTPEQAVKVASLIDDYMDYQQQFLESKGMVEFEEE